MLANTKKRERGGASILCPLCERPSRVLQTRRSDDGTVRRERLCPACSAVFDTNESIRFPLGSVEASAR
jgi:transcriptional regulator NrdR family protein